MQQLWKELDAILESMINELHYRELFYKTFNSLSKIGRRKTVDEKTREDLEYQLLMKMAELSEINTLLKDKGTKPLYQSSYNVVYGNYRRLLEEEIGKLKDRLRFGQVVQSYHLL